MDGSSWTTITGTSPILAEEYTEPFEVFSPKYFPGVPGTSPAAHHFPSPMTNETTVPRNQLSRN